jgi:hypothetical protein
VEAGRIWRRRTGGIYHKGNAHEKNEITGRVSLVHTRILHERARSDPRSKRILRKFQVRRGSVKIRRSQSFGKERQ